MLEEAYRRIRGVERSLQLADLAPEEALRRLVGFTVDYPLANPDSTRLVMNENTHRGEYLARSKTIQKLKVPAIDAVRDVYERDLESPAALSARRDSIVERVVRFVRKQGWPGHGAVRRPTPRAGDAYFRNWLAARGS